MESEKLTPGLKERAKRLFFLSDAESKGFIVRRDMQRMRSEVPLPPEQLEAVFDSLDRERNGFLTLQQFLQGFGSFLSSGPGKPTNKPEVLSSIPEHDDPCHLLLEGLSRSPMITLQSLRHLCDVIAREGYQQMQTDMEAVLSQLDEDVKRVEAQQSALQETARTREDAHDQQVRKLFEELESTLTDEKLQAASQFESRLSQLRRKMEEEISNRDQLLQEVTSQRDETEARLAEERRTSAALRQDKEELATCCAQQAAELDKLRAHGTRTRDPATRSDPHLHVASGFKLAQRMFRQEQGLMEQLSILRAVASTLEDAKTSQQVLLDQQVTSRKRVSN